ncbi:hypothetical protein [Thalassotalea litorea]|uniref:hypothetical protein n=1 Tax=Thalassotalea litorea TaxID=2020715 RepID=UPI0037352ABD
MSFVEGERQSPSFSSSYYVALLGSIPNFVAVVAYSAVALFIARGAEQYYKYLIGFSIGIIGYEILQIWIDWRIFDWVDILGTIIGFTFVFWLSKVFEFWWQTKRKLEQSNLNFRNDDSERKL